MIKKFSQILLCLFIFFLELAQAQDSHIDSTTAQTCHPNLELIPQEFTDIMKTLFIQPMFSFLDELGFNSASEEDISSTPCRNEAPSQEEMENWLIEWAGTDTKINERTHGVSFVEENPKMLNLFKTLNTYRIDIDGGRAPFSSKYKMETDCKKVICAMKQSLGEKEGVQLLYMLAKYGFNGSPLAFEINKEDWEFWKSDELDQALVALQIFQKIFSQLQKIDLLYVTKEEIWKIHVLNLEILEQILLLEFLIVRVLVRNMGINTQSFTKSHMS